MDVAASSTALWSNPSPPIDIPESSQLHAFLCIVMNRSNVEFHAKLQLVCQFVRRNEKALQDSSSRLTHSWLIYIDNNLLWTKYNIKDKNEMFNCGVVMLNQLVRIVPMQVADFFSVAHLQRGTPRSLVDKVQSHFIFRFYAVMNVLSTVNEPEMKLASRLLLLHPLFFELYNSWSYSHAPPRVPFVETQVALLQFWKAHPASLPQHKSFFTETLVRWLALVPPRISGSSADLSTLETLLVETITRTWTRSPPLPRMHETELIHPTEALVAVMESAWRYLAAAAPLLLGDTCCTSAAERTADAVVGNASMSIVCSIFNDRVRSVCSVCKTSLYLPSSTSLPSSAEYRTASRSLSLLLSSLAHAPTLLTVTIGSIAKAAQKLSAEANSRAIASLLTTTHVSSVVGKDGSATVPFDPFPCILAMRGLRLAKANDVLRHAVLKSAAVALKLIDAYMEGSLYTKSDKGEGQMLLTCSPTDHEGNVLYPSFANAVSLFCLSLLSVDNINDFACSLDDVALASYNNGSSRDNNDKQKMSSLVVRLRNVFFAFLRQQRHEWASHLKLKGEGEAVSTAEAKNLDKHEYIQTMVDSSISVSCEDRMFRNIGIGNRPPGPVTHHGDDDTWALRGLVLAAPVKELCETIYALQHRWPEGVVFLGQEVISLIQDAPVISAPVHISGGLGFQRPDSKVLSAIVQTHRPFVLRKPSYSRLPASGQKRSLPAMLSEFTKSLNPGLSSSPSLGHRGLQPSQPVNHEDVAATLRERMLLRKGFSGLNNLGNTCYMNAVIQSLFHSDEFRRRILLEADPDVNDKALSTVFFSGLQLVFALLERTIRVSISPFSLHKALPPFFRDAAVQHDATEFLKYLMDTIEAAHRKSRCRPGPSLDCPEKKDVKPTDLFTGATEQCMRCLVCGSRSKRTEEFVDIELPFPETASAEDPSSAMPSVDPKVCPLSLDDLLKSYFEPEVMNGENCYHCERCSVKQPAMKEVSIVRFPKFLIIAFRRYVYDQTLKVRRKIMREVQFDKTLHISAHQLQGDNQDFSMTDENGRSTTSAEYSLFSAIVHSGASAAAGHYYAIARSSEGISSPPQRSLSSPSSSSSARDHWRCFNDSHVSDCSFSFLQSLATRKPLDQVYMLFYVQCNDMQQLQQARCPVSNISTGSTPSAACDTPNVFEAEGVSEEKEHSHLGAFCFEALVNEDNLKCIEDELRAKHAPNAWAAAILSLKEKQEKERSTQAASAVDDDARLLELAQLDSMRWTDMD